MCLTVEYIDTKVGGQVEELMACKGILNKNTLVEIKDKQLKADIGTQSTVRSIIKEDTIFLQVTRNPSCIKSARLELLRVEVFSPGIEV